MQSEIFLTCGTKVKVSEEDFAYLSYWPWHKTGRGKGYAARKESGRHLYMHKIIAQRMGLDGEIDHKDRNTMNNQRDNLRKLSHQHNLVNQGVRSNNKSGYKGVSWSKPKQKWRATIMLNSKQVELGIYDTEEAALAYNQAAKDAYGDLAQLNCIGAKQ